MAFKLVTFTLILIIIAVLGMRGYRAAVRRFEAAELPPTATLPGRSTDPEH
ncbi:hypothetical protein ACFQ4M_13715 [Thauera mechernichensis]|uniref:Uncharacterized protein n=1 Tax=Thauera mechernichensis TaxID=82788 RepID=A0ABW3WHQ0_9RHOO|nr:MULTISPECIES: hypothetical protein [Thauera]ENO83270.1 hypothetical protein B447_00725 [Thauera sp. 27]ENO93203.1 hypothetical protein C662_08120 [Thauera sp. 28]MDG3064760.1 hypothetical protein [Thauera mechernichensis]WBL62729.1 hypothetical protein LQF09_11550 [Thauera sp. WB-2]HNR59969.1 hypothetical protein [Thauera sp.]